MSEAPKKQPESGEPTLAERVGKKAARKVKARRRGTQSVWLGLGMMGLVGWSVAVPTLLGAALGLWLDEHYPVSYSWTLTMLIIGLFIGCLNAWYWVSREHRELQQNEEDNNE